MHRCFVWRFYGCCTRFQGMCALQAKLIQEKSMIGRLQNELVRVNSQVGELDTQLERVRRSEADAERLQQRVAALEAGHGSVGAELEAAHEKVC